MPELPEVETIRRQLERAIVGRKVIGVEVIKAKKINVPAKKLAGILKGTKVTSVGRRAKLLLLSFSNSRTAVIHLKMTGRLLIKAASAKPSPHTFAVFTLSGGRKLFWDDIRMFGYLKLIETSRLADFLAGQGFGPEPLEKAFTLNVLKSCFKKYSKKKIKPLLMEGKCVVGLGNIYAAEVLAYSGVSPLRRAGDITGAESVKIFRGTKKILREAIKSRGSSSDAYLDAFGKKGAYVPKLKVYGREGKKCAYCAGKIKKIVLGGRGTYFCPSHQR